MCLYHFHALGSLDQERHALWLLLNGLNRQPNFVVLVNPCLTLVIDRKSFTLCSRDTWTHMRCSFVVREHCVLVIDAALNNFGDTCATNTLLARTWNVDVVGSEHVDDAQMRWHVPFYWISLNGVRKRLMSLIGLFCPKDSVKPKSRASPAILHHLPRRP